jgi:hypothetical protein
MPALRRAVLFGLRALCYPQGRRFSAVLERRRMQQGPHVKIRHGGASRGRPIERLERL